LFQIFLAVSCLLLFAAAAKSQNQKEREAKIFWPAEIPKRGLQQTAACCWLLQPTRRQLKGDTYTLDE
jgi:hypothetical protein